MFEIRRMTFVLVTVAITITAGGLSLPSSTPSPSPESSPPARSTAPDPKGSSDLPPADPKLGSMFPAYYDELVSIDKPVTQLTADYPEIAGPLSWDPSTTTLSLGYYSQAGSSSDVSRFMTEAATITPSAPVKFALTPISYNYAAREATAADMAANPSEWKTFFGSAVMADHLDPSTGELHVSLATTPDKPSTQLPDGTPVVIDPPVTVDLQVGRTADTSPWFDGDKISDPTGAYRCTSGFAWKKWSTSEILGSTADHCSVASGSLTWLQNSHAFGHGILSNPNVDTILLRADGSSSFDAPIPSVWVGPAVTSVSRPVVNFMATPAVGETVALSAAVSGLNSGPIWATGYYYGSKGPWVLVNWSGCLGGDSGGTWLTTQSGTGYVVAWGQHEALVTYPNGAQYCAFEPLNPISSALQASIVLD
jgi:hypothetical protein